MGDFVRGEFDRLGSSSADFASQVQLNWAKYPETQRLAKAAGVRIPNPARDTHLSLQSNLPPPSTGCRTKRQTQVVPEFLANLTSLLIESPSLVKGSGA